MMDHVRIGALVDVVAVILVVVVVDVAVVDLRLPLFVKFG